MKNRQIGFIGLGQMGAPMARALIRAGYQVTGFDLNMLPDEHIQTAESSRHIADQSDIVITMLPDGTAVKTVTDDILPVMRKIRFSLIVPRLMWRQRNLSGLRQIRRALIFLMPLCLLVLSGQQQGH